MIIIRNTRPASYLSKHAIHTGILFCITVLLHQTAFGEKLPPDNNPSVSATVEIGAGGNIKLEKEYRTKTESLFEWHAHLLWESRYVTEGRDNLSGKSLASISSEFTLDKLTIVPWIADSPGADYSELNLNAVYGFVPAENIDIFVGYTNIQARDSGTRSNDNEISIDLAYSVLDDFTLSANAYHSYDAKGTFIELSAKYQYLAGENLHLGLQCILGANAGYIPNGHNGLNHIQLRTGLAYHPLNRMEVYAYAGYNLAINRDITRYIDDELLDDFFWSGIGFVYRF